MCISGAIHPQIELEISHSEPIIFPFLENPVYSAP